MADTHTCNHGDHGHEAHKPKNVSSDPNAIYTCPMHPEIRQVGPGSCPKCGMGLEPLIADDSENDVAWRRAQ